MTDAIAADFLALVAPYEGAIRMHCYRMLGSLQDSEDALQETLIRAWRAKDKLADRDALRPWLYRIATNACLDELATRKSRPMPMAVVPPADPARARADWPHEPTWLEPCPDAWLAGVSRDPGAVYEIKESVALAFVAALQCLTAPQRAVLLLRDVLGMSAEETAAALDMSVSAANSTLHRARVALRERVGGTGDVIDATSEVDDALLARYIQAWQALDLPALVALLHDDIVASMPPSPTWLAGKAATSAFLAARPFRLLAGQPIVMVPALANGQPAFGFYTSGALHAVHVVRIRGGRVLEMHHFCDAAPLARAFGLPLSSPGR